MTALTSPPDVVHIPEAVPQQCIAVTLYGVPWELYCQLRDLEENWTKRMTYDSGTLEIMSPIHRHERLSKVLGFLILEWTDERDVDVESGGTMTFRRKDLKRGLEPDDCFYLRHAQAIRDTEQIDLSVDPPPDLALEVDVTSPSLPKLPIYASLGVPEVWIWKSGRLQPLVLVDSQYEESSMSVELPGFPLADAARIMLENWKSGQKAIRREFRKLIQATP